MPKEKKTFNPVGRSNLQEYLVCRYYHVCGLGLRNITGGKVSKDL